jgi:5,10-methylenetetrahydromethanopterin reductase
MKIDVILDARAEADEIAELGRLAEQNGIRGVWVSSLLDSRDPFTNLSVLARSSSTIYLGPVAVNPYDIHPVRIASAFMTLNELAGGRARLVIGGGGEALEAVGIKPDRRVRAVRECVDIIKSASTGKPFDYTGQMYQVNNLALSWVKAEVPPVYVGASMEQMLGMAARTADGIMMSDMPPVLAANAIATLDKNLAGAGKSRPDFATNAFAAWHVYPDREQAQREARRWLVLRGIFRPWLLQEFLSQSDVDQVMASRGAFWKAFGEGSHIVEGVSDAVLDALVDHVTLTGTVDDLEQKIEKLKAYEAAGLSAISLRLYSDPAASIRLLGERVVPLLG